MPAYKIGNPRGIEKGTRILRFPCHYPDPKTGELAVEKEPDEFGNPVLKLRKGMTEDIEWFDGDEFVKPEGMSQKGVEGWIDIGIIEVIPDVLENPVEETEEGTDA